MKALMVGIICTCCIVFAAEHVRQAKLWYQGETYLTCWGKQKESGIIFFAPSISLEKLCSPCESCQFNNWAQQWTTLQHFMLLVCWIESQLVKLHKHCIFGVCGTRSKLKLDLVPRTTKSWKSCNPDVSSSRRQLIWCQSPEQKRALCCVCCRQVRHCRAWAIIQPLVCLRASLLQMDTTFCCTTWQFILLDSVLLQFIHNLVVLHMLH